MSFQEPHHLHPFIDTFHLSQVHSHKYLACKHEGDAPCSKFSHSLPDEILPPLYSPRLLTNSSVWLTQSYFLLLPFESGSCIPQNKRTGKCFFYNRWIQFAYLRIPLSVSPAHDSRISLIHVYHLYFLSSSPERCLTHIVFKLVSTQHFPAYWLLNVCNFCY